MNIGGNDPRLESGYYLKPGLDKGGPHMARLARALSYVIGTDRETKALKIIIIFSGAGLFVSALLLTYALDLPPGLF